MTSNTKKLAKTFEKAEACTKRKKAQKLIAKADKLQLIPK